MNNLNKSTYNFTRRRRPAGPVQNNFAFQNNARVFPYTNNLQSVPIYVDTPYRAGAGIDLSRPNENLYNTEPFETYTNRREANTFQTESQRVYLDPLAESPMLPNQGQLVRPEQPSLSLMHYSRQNPMSNRSHPGPAIPMIIFLIEKSLSQTETAMFDMSNTIIVSSRTANLCSTAK